MSVTGPNQVFNTPPSVDTLAALQTLPSGMPNGAFLLCEETGFFWVLERSGIVPGGSTAVPLLTAAPAQWIKTIPAATGVPPVGGGAIIFDDAGGPLIKSNMRGTRVAQSPIDNTKTGINNFASQSAPGPTGATANYVTLGGGDRHSAASDYATVPGGLLNRISAGSIGATIGGGRNNLVDGVNTDSVIGGGNGNQIIGDNGFGPRANVVGGGFGNVVQDSECAGIASGFLNQVFRSDRGYVAGGEGNVAGSPAGAFGWQFVGGGARNNVVGNFAGSLAGEGNTLDSGFIGFGSAHHSAIVAGQTNTNAGAWSTIISGQNNRIVLSAGANQGPTYSIVSCGNGNTITGDQALIAAGIFASMACSIDAGAAGALRIGEACIIAASSGCAMTAAAGPGLGANCAIIASTLTTFDGSLGGGIGPGSIAVGAQGCTLSNSGAGSAFFAAFSGTIRDCGTGCIIIGGGGNTLDTCGPTTLLAGVDGTSFTRSAPECFALGGAPSTWSDVQTGCGSIACSGGVTISSNNGPNNGPARVVTIASAGIAVSAATSTNGLYFLGCDGGTFNVDPGATLLAMTLVGTAGASVTAGPGDNGFGPNCFMLGGSGNQFDGVGTGIGPACGFIGGGSNILRRVGPSCGVAFSDVITLDTCGPECGAIFSSACNLTNCAPSCGLVSASACTMTGSVATVMIACTSGTATNVSYGLVHGATPAARLPLEHTHGGGSFAAPGDAQELKLPIRQTYAGGGPAIILDIDAATPVTLVDDHAYEIDVDVVARDVATGARAGFSHIVLVHQTAGVVAVDGDVDLDPGATLNVPGWNFSVSGGASLDVTFQGGANDVHASGTLTIREVG